MYEYDKDTPEKSIDHNYTEKFLEFFFDFIKHPVNLLKHPVVSGSVIYIFVSGWGFLMSTMLYRRFHISIINYVELSDFFLAAFKYILPVFGLFGLFVFGKLLYKIIINTECLEKYQDWCFCVLYPGVFYLAIHLICRNS